MAESTITAKGQTTVPASIRQHIHGTAGTRLVWHALADGRLLVRVKNKSVADLAGMLTPATEKHVAIDEMRPCTWRHPSIPMSWCASLSMTTGGRTRLRSGPCPTT